MTRTVLLTLVLLSSRLVAARDVPRPNLDGAEPPVVARMNARIAAVEASPSSAETWGRYAMFLHAQRCLAEADIAYAEAHRLDPTDFRWPYFRGLVVLKTDPPKSLQHLDRAVQLDATYGPAYVRLGLVLQEVGREHDARRAFLEAIRLQPTDAVAHMYLGQLELKRNELEAAIRHLETARSGRPDDSAVLSSLARAYAKQGDRSRARELAEAAQKTRPGRPFADRRFNEVVNEAVTMQSFLDRSNVYLKAGSNDKAVSELQAALTLGHDAGPIHAVLARLYLKFAQYDKCVESSQTAIAAGHGNKGLHLVRGAGLFYLSRFDEAENAVGRALDAAPSDIAAMRLHGRIAAARGDDAEAIARWNRALAIDDDDATRRERAKARSRLGQHDEAVTELRELLTIAPDDSATWLALGEVYRGAGDLGAALNAFDRAAENATTPFAGRQSASVLMVQRRFAEARIRLRILRQQWPRNSNLRNDLAWLLSTCPDQNVRNGTEAMRVIRPLVQQTRRKEPAVLDTFAAALAEVGRFSEATTAMDEVLALLPSTIPAETRAGYQQRRDHYARKKAWRNGS